MGDHGRGSDECLRRDHADREHGDQDHNARLHRIGPARHVLAPATTLEWRGEQDGEEFVVRHHTQEHELDDVSDDQVRERFVNWLNHKYKKGTLAKTEESRRRDRKPRRRRLYDRPES
jgi:hypothetical protein